MLCDIKHVYVIQWRWCEVALRPTWSPFIVVVDVVDVNLPLMNQGVEFWLLRDRSALELLELRMQECAREECLIKVGCGL